MTVHLSDAQIAGYLLAIARATAWVIVTPPFAGRVLPGQVKLGLSFALALAIAPTLAAREVSLEVGPLVAAAALQAAAGLALGYIAVLVLGVVQAAGGIVDALAGFSAATLFDPTTSSTTTAFGRFYQVLAITLIFVTDGHLLIVQGFVRSVEAAPLTSLSLSDLADVMTSGMSGFLIAALEIAGPLVAALLAAELAVALLAKAAPQSNAFLLGIPFKVLVTLAVAGVALTRLPGAVQTLLERVVRDGLGIIGG